MIDGASLCYAANLPQAIASPAQPSIYDLEISIHYRKSEMLKTTLHAPSLQLHYHHEAPDLKAHQHICFPSTDGLLDHKQVRGYMSVSHYLEESSTLTVEDLF